jgi:CRISPR-associated protein Csc2
MRNEEGEQSEALFDFVKVQPGNDLIHFVTLEAATGPMLLYVLHNILNTGKYGARETRTGRNIRNEIVGVILGDHDTSLSTGEFLMEYHDDDAALETNLGSYIGAVQRTDWEVYGEVDEGAAFPEWFDRMYAVAERTADDADDVLREELTRLKEEAVDVFSGDD